APVSAFAEHKTQRLGALERVGRDAAAADGTVRAGACGWGDRFCARASVADGAQVAGDAHLSACAGTRRPGATAGRTSGAHKSQAGRPIGRAAGGKQR
ncbi:MAG: hypothetical protein ACPIOQ_51330, partial [Promethearchaeia archaeon]